MTARDPRAWMWNEALAMIERAEHLHRRFFEPGFSPIHAVSWQPPVDIFETDQGILIVVALPGVEPGDFEVSVDGDIVVVVGTRRQPAPARGAAVHRLEIPYGRFERRIRLPSANLALRRAELVNGCLMLNLTKRL